MVGAVFGEFRSSVCSGHVHVRGDLELERGPEQQQQHGEPDEGETRKKHADDARQCNAAEGQKSCGGDEEGRAGSNTLVLRCFGDGPKQQQAEVTVPLPWWVKVKALSQTSTNADQGLTSFHALLCPVKDPFSHDQRSPSEHPSESLASSKSTTSLACKACRVPITADRLNTFPLPSLRWHEIQDFVNCCEDDHHSHVDLSVTIGEDQALYDAEQVLLRESQLQNTLAPAPASQQSSAATADDTRDRITCRRCRSSLGARAVFQSQPCVSLHRHAIATTPQLLPHVSLVQTLLGVLQERMKSFGWSKFLLTTDTDASNPMHMLLWIPSPHPVHVLSAQIERSPHHPKLTRLLSFPALKVLFKHSLAGDSSAASSSGTVQQWHHSDSVAELTVPTEMLLAGVRTLEATRVLQPQDHRAIAGFAAGHLPLDAAWQAGNG